MSSADLIRGLAGMNTGRGCRRCGEPISPLDRFGSSESVCWPCRRESERGSIRPLRPLERSILRDAA